MKKNYILKYIIHNTFLILYSQMYEHKTKNVE